MMEARVLSFAGGRRRLLSPVRSTRPASFAKTTTKALFIYYATTSSLLLLLILIVEAATNQTSYKLDCQPGELRHFNYESATKVWGSQGQEVRLRASLRLRCMEPADNTSLKYLAEVISLSPSFSLNGQVLAGEEDRKLKKQKGSRKQQVVELAARSVNGKLNSVELLKLENQERALLLEETKVEPVLEEVAETADRVRKTISGWLNKTWGSVRDFFSNIFTTSEKTTVSREQAFKETGLDIGSQCKSSGKDSKGLPIDDSLFDDLEPKYYISAASLEPGSAYEFDDEKQDSPNVNQEEEEDLNLSFFDEPNSRRRSKRAATSGGRKSRRASNEPENYEKLLKIPFIFIQSKTGRILEIKFSVVESDASVKNFKRHICDIFATNLDQNKSQMNEVSPIGRHTTEYLVDNSGNSSAIKQSLESTARVAESRQLIRALAVVGDNLRQLSEEQEEEVPTEKSSDVSVLRTINSTSNIQSSSKNIAPDIDRLQVQVKQVQQISEGRLIGAAGQLGMSLLASSREKILFPARVRRSTDEASVEDIGELMQVSTTFSVQLVPLGKLPPQSSPVESERSGRSRRAAETVNVSLPELSGKPAANSSRAVKPIERFVKRPKGGEELRRVMGELKELESDLQLTSSSLLAEWTSQDNQLERLELLRDQIQMRLNEELMRNRARRSNSARQTPAASLAKSSPSQEESKETIPNELGLSLTQLVIDTGLTSKRKGSVYSTLEELIQLEAVLEEDALKSSVSRLLRETVRLDKLRSHCKSSVATIEEIKSQSGRIELKEPFNVGEEEPSERLLASAVELTANRKRKRLEQCKQLSRLLLRVGDKKAIDLMLDLMDDCNARMLAGAKHEELGYGPTSRYFRNLRQQFTELLAEVGKPTESLLDRLMYRLQFQPAGNWQGKTTNRNSNKLVVGGDSSEFTYVSKPSSKSPANNNKSLLREEDELNNNEAAGSLVMTITELAAKSSIGKAKRVDIAERLLNQLKSTTCQLFKGPDLDILESMANFREPLEEIVGKVVHLARRCRSQEQYLVACVHALQGQLGHATSQRFLAETLRSGNVSCTVKSEIVATLLGAIIQEELKQSFNSQSASGSAGWPATGRNQVDEVLLELVDKSNGRRQADRRCLSQLVEHYLSRKLDSASFARAADMKKKPSSRQKRAVVNDNDFWDEAHCKRWLLPPADNSTLSHSPTSGGGFELADENSDIDDNLIFNSLASGSRKQSRKVQSSLKLIEREALPNSISEALASQFIRKRHKCTASKTYGPKNAQAQLKAEVVNDLVGANNENKFLARFRLSANFLGNKLDVGRMYLWHQKRMTRAHVNILGKSLWDTAHTCQDKPPTNLLYMPLFDFNLWLVKLSVGLKVQSEMGFFSNCDQQNKEKVLREKSSMEQPVQNSLDELELFPTISLRASGEASAKFVFARAGLSLASQYGYQGSIKVSRQPESCMSVYSAHQPMNVTLSSWFQLWDSDCHFWGSRNRAEPLATRWRLTARKPTAWLDEECLAAPSRQTGNGTTAANIKERRRLFISP